MQTGTLALRITRGWQQQKFKSAFSQKNSQNDERWSKLRERSCNKKSMVRRIIWLKLPQEAGDEQGCYRNGSETREPLKRRRENRERPSRMNYYNQENQSAKSPQENNFFLEESIKRETCTSISLRWNHCVLWNCTGKLVANRIVEDMVKQTWSFLTVIKKEDGQCFKLMRG